MHRVVSVTPMAGYRLDLTFEDGSHGIVDLSYLAGRGVFSIWNEHGSFESVRIGSSGELMWGEAADLCADALHQRLVQPNDAGLVVGA